MGILRKREELMSVTCAVLKDDARTSFFTALKKKAGGRMERIAKACGASVHAASDWASGKTHIPYLSLQRLAQEFHVNLPAVNELRREFQPVVEVRPPRRTARPAATPPKPSSGQKTPAARQPRKPAAAPAANPAAGRRSKASGSGRRRRGPAEAKEAAGRPKPPAKPKTAKRRPAEKAQGPRVPKLSSQLAHWTGVLLAAARREEDSVTLSADRRMGQNFAASWANTTEDLFGVKPSLAMSDDRKRQEARLPTQGIEDFLDRIEMRAGGEAPGAPRWIWSSPEWKKAFMKGVTDASASFHRTPALLLMALPERLRDSSKKMMAAMGFTLKEDKDKALVLEGRKPVEQYFTEIGSENLKLHDQLKAYIGAGERSPASRPRKRRRRGGSGRRQARKDAPEGAQHCV
ncbi:MAG: hypothetical protein ABII00_19055 [Elusimicrobiota bacterium]